MDFKEIVLAILNNRKQIICPEKNLIADFTVKEKNFDSLSKWCEENHLAYKHFPRKHTIKLTKLNNNN